MIPVKELIEWLKSLPEDSSVGVDEGGLILLCEEAPGAYFEIGGMLVDEEDLDKPPERLETWSVDEVAECLSGIASGTYDELWKCMVDAEASGTDKPLGGDGSNGTTEIPIVSSGEYESDLVAAWPKLSEEARRNIIQCAK